LSFKSRPEGKEKVNRIRTFAYDIETRFHRKSPHSVEEHYELSPESFLVEIL